MADVWSKEEVRLIIADYLEMLYMELTELLVNKTEHRSKIKLLLNNRSNGSIEFKHQNISAVLIKLELPYIRGYKPRWNYQDILESEMITFLDNNRNKFEPSFQLFSDSEPSFISNFDFRYVLDIAPEYTLNLKPAIKYERKPIKINYLEREQRNIALAIKGEEFIVEYEKWRLINEGKESLAKQINWISQQDDGAGFDILSKNIDGSNRYIEVKTTKLNKNTPFFFTKNEFEFSKQESENYYLYRLFNFSQSPKLFCLRGNFDSFCNKEAIQYKGSFDLLKNLK